MALTTLQVQQLYLGYYGRPADPVGMAYWQTQTLDVAMAGFAASAEFTNQYAGMTVTQQVAQVYVNLLGREADLPGLLYWANEIVAGRETIGTLVMSIQESALGRDVTTLQMRWDFSEAFTAALDTTPEVLAYSGQAAAEAARDAMADIVAASTGDTSTLTTALANLGAIVAEVTAVGGVTGQTFTLTAGVDNIVGTSGNDLIIGYDNDYQTADDRTINIADTIDGGAGIDTLKIVANANEVSLVGVTITSVEKLLVQNVNPYFEELNIANHKFDTVTIDYMGTDHRYDLYIDNIDGQTTLIIDNATGDWNSSFYRNDDEKYDATEGTVSVTNTISNFDAVTEGSSSYFYGYEFFSKATTVNHTFNVINLDGGDQGLWVYDYIKASADNATINSTINIENANTPGYYSGFYFNVENSATVATADVVNVVANIKNSDGVDFVFDSYNSGESSKSDVITYNIDGLAMTYGYNELWSYGFETINVNVSGDAALEYLGDSDVNADTNGTMNIVANADLSVNYTYFGDDTAKNVTVNVSGSGNVDLGEAYLGDGGATDVVTVNAAALTGDFSIYDSYGYAATITSGAGDDTIRVGSNATSVNAGAGDNLVDIGDYDYSAADAGTLTVGAGVDTLKMTAANADAMDATTDFNAKVTGFDKLWLTGATSQTLNLANVAGLTSNVTLEGNADTLTLNNLSSGATVQLRDASTITVLNVKDAGTGTADVLNLALNGNAATVGFGTVTAASVETVNINSTTRQADPTTVTNTASLSATAHKTINVSGNAALDLSDVALTSVTTVAAAAFNAGLEIDLATNANNVTVTVGAGDNIITGGAGKDTITITGDGDNYVDGGADNDTITIAGDGDNEVYGGAGNDIISLGNGDNYVDGGAGNDTITVGNGDNEVLGGAGNDTITVGNGDNTITGGLGADAITLGSGVNTLIYESAADSSGLNIDTVTGFVAGNLGTVSAPEFNVFDFADVLAAAIADLDIVNIAAGAGVDFVGNFSSITAANTALSSGNALEIVYVSADNSIYVDYNGDGVINVGDMVIELTGMTGTLVDGNFGL